MAVRDFSNKVPTPMGSSDDGPEQYAREEVDYEEDFDIWYLSNPSAFSGMDWEI